MNVMTVSVVFVEKLQKRNKKQKMRFVVLLLLSIHMSLMESVRLLLIGLNKVLNMNCNRLVMKNVYITTIVVLSVIQNVMYVSTVWVNVHKIVKMIVWIALIVSVKIILTNILKILSVTLLVLLLLVMTRTTMMVMFVKNVA